MASEKTLTPNPQPTPTEIWFHSLPALSRETNAKPMVGWVAMTLGPFKKFVTPLFLFNVQLYATSSYTKIVP